VCVIFVLLDDFILLYDKNTKAIRKRWKIMFTLFYVCSVLVVIVVTGLIVDGVVVVVVGLLVFVVDVVAVGVMAVVDDSKIAVSGNAVELVGEFAVDDEDVVWMWVDVVSVDELLSLGIVDGLV
jgi:hypothetical protein